MLRSWLQSADSAFSGKQKQLMLVLDNLNISVESGTDMLAAVTDAWKAAMKFMENIVVGRPQAVKSGAVLLAMSAWHLYPDLEVIHSTTTTVKQNDQLITKGGIVTIGLENPNVDNDLGISWSLPLSQLQYYGKAVLATSSVNSSSSRVSIQQLVVVALGCAVGTWAKTTEEIEICAKIIVVIEKTIAKAKIDPPKHISILSSASRIYLASTGETKREFESLFSFGQRRASTFLSETGRTLSPWFNLKDVLTFANVLQGSEQRIQWLRRQYDEVKRSRSEYALLLKFAVIRYDLDEDEIPKPGYINGSILEESGHTPSAHTTHPDRIDRQFIGSDRYREFASLDSVYVGDDGNPSHRRWLPSKAENFTLKENYKGSGYSPMSTFAIERAAQLNAKAPEAITYHFLGDVLYGSSAYYEAIFPTELHGVHNSRMRWETSHVKSLPSKVQRGFGIHEHPCSDLYSSAGSNGYHGYTYRTPIPTPNSRPRYFPRVSQYLHRLGKANASPNQLLKEIRAMERRLEHAIKDDPHLGLGSLQTPSTSDWQYFNRLQKLLQQTFEDSCRISASGNTTPSSWVCTPESKSPVDCDCLHSWYLLGTKPGNCDSQNYVKSSTPERKIELWLPVSSETSTSTGQSFPELSPESVLTNLESYEPNPQWLSRLVCLDGEDSGPEYLELMSSLGALHFAFQLYSNLPDAQVELSITKDTLSKYSWSKTNIDDSEHARSFACIASLETGYLNTNPSTINHVMGISVASSLYVAQFVWSDPYVPLPKSTIRRSIGNVGKKGMAFLISPQNPNMKEPGYDKWKVVQHAPFDGLFENNFAETSLHFSFTGYELPIDTGEHGLKDKDVYFLQSVVQAYEGSNWVADLDILEAFINRTGKGAIWRLATQCRHNAKEASDFKPLGNVVSIDCWDELLDDTQQTSIVRANGNWLARLALTVVAYQRGRKVVIADKKVCWACVIPICSKNVNPIVIC
jgi:hypothetical protein